MARAFELYAAHRAFSRWATAGKEAADQGGQAAQVVGARATRLTHHINGNRAQLPKRDIKLKVFEVLANGRTNHALRIGGLDPGQGHRTHPGNVDKAIAVYGGAHLYFHRTPAPNQHFITRTQGVIARHGRIDQRGKWVTRELRVGKKVHPKQRQRQARRLPYKFLEFVWA